MNHAPITAEEVKYRGRPLTECSRDELIKGITSLMNRLRTEERTHDLTLGMLTAATKAATRR